MPKENFITLAEVVEWAAVRGYLYGESGSLDVEREYLPTLGLSPEKYGIEQSVTELGWTIHRRGSQ